MTWRQCSTTVWCQPSNIKVHVHIVLSVWCNISALLLHEHLPHLNPPLSLCLSLHPPLRHAHFFFFYLTNKFHSHSSFHSLPLSHFPPLSIGPLLFHVGYMHTSFQVSAAALSALRGELEKRNADELTEREEERSGEREREGDTVREVERG